MCLKPITTPASRDHSCFASEPFDGEKRENYTESQKGVGGGGGAKRELSFKA